MGRFLLSRLVEAGHEVYAYTRSDTFPAGENVQWFNSLSKLPLVEALLCAAPIWALPQFFNSMTEIQRQAIRRVVAFSSTSRFSKVHSLLSEEQKVVDLLVEGETWLQEAGHTFSWTLFRPTIIYAPGIDKNLSQVARFIGRFGFFPLLGKGKGLRQPVHADDLAKAVLSVLFESKTFGGIYNLGGGEILSYRGMVARIFEGMGKRPRFFALPFFLVALLVFLVRIIPRYRMLNIEMFKRMDQDLIFDFTQAKNDFAYLPRDFSYTLPIVLIQT